MYVPEFSPTVPELLRNCVSRGACSPMIVHGNRKLSYSDVERQSAEIAKGLLSRGIGKGGRVAIWMPNGPDWLIAWAAAARVGALVVPLNTFYRPREVGWALAHSDTQCLLTYAKFLNNDHLAMLERAIPELSTQKNGKLRLSTHPYLREIHAWGDSDRPWCHKGPEALQSAAREDSAIDDEFLRAVEDCVTPADPMVMIYSSGSTADPKGAVHSHGTVIRHSHNLNQFRDLLPTDRMYSPMPFFWVGGFVYSMLSIMHVGACMLTEDSFEPGETLKFLERERVTLLAGWPHYSKAMAEHPSFPERDLSSIRGGNLYEMLPADMRPNDPELRSNSLGMTETCGPHTMDRMDVEMPEKLRGSFGHAVPGVEHKVVHPDTGERLPAGEFGEICVRGYSLMQGLYKVEREDVYDADGFYHTGDGGYFNAEGVLFFSGRLGDLIKTGGANVTPREVEVVIESIPAVREAYVVGLPDKDRGQLVVAAVVLQSGEQMSAEEMRVTVKAELSAYKVPKDFHIYRHDDLPFTDSGKIDKRALLAMIEQASSQESA
jgi:acyl-CoA synthetase (AMP-forming)/AMP-acid ligase II